MAKDRPQGRTSRSTAGTDPPAGAHRPEDADGGALSDGRGPTVAGEEGDALGGALGGVMGGPGGPGGAGAAWPEPPDEAELDERERRKGPDRKPPGPGSGPGAGHWGAAPAAPPPTAPPPTDPR
jgi:hypothetical protein